MLGSPQGSVPFSLTLRPAKRPHWVVALTLGVTLLVWGVAWVSIASQVGAPFPGFFCNPDRAYSGFTPPDFTGPQAGLQRWDVIVAVNGRSWREMGRLVAEAGVGGTLVYTVQRGDEALEIPVRTMVFTWDTVMAFLPGYLVSSLVFVGIGILVYLHNPAAPLNRYLLAYLLVWAVGAGIIWESFLSQNKWLGSLLIPYAVIAPVAGWVFFWIFPTDLGWRRFLDRTHIIRTFVILGGAAIVVMSAFRCLAYVLDRPSLWRWLAFVQGWPYFVVFGLGSVPLKGLPLVRLVARRGDRLVRQQAAVMLVGLLVGLAGWYLFVWTPAAIHIRPVSRAPWGSIVPAVYPLSIGFAIVRYRLLDIRVVVRKGLVYSLLTAILTTAFLLLSLLSGYIFHGLTGRQSLLAMVVPALLVAFLFQPARGRIQTFVDRAFFRRDYEVGQTLTRFSRDLSTLRAQEEVVRLVRNTIVKTLGARGATVWTLKGDRYHAAPATDDGSGGGFAAGGPLATALAKARAPLYALPDDPAPHSAELCMAGAEVAVPLFLGDGLAGILTLDSRLSGEPYGQGDLDLLTMLAQSTALALENARLYEERLALLRQQFIQGAAIQEEERRRIARELHDGVGSALAGLNIGLHRVRKHLEAERSPVAAEVHLLAAETQASIQEIRRLVYDLRPAALDELGLVAALRAYVSRCRGDHGLDVSLTVATDSLRLAPAVETTLFRIAQEALTNAARHASAEHIEVRLACEPGQVVLEVCDDGRGFVHRAPVAGAHLGLWSMQKRVEQFGGGLFIDSAPGRGTLVRAWIPLDDGLADGR